VAGGGSETPPYPFMEAKVKLKFSKSIRFVPTFHGNKDLTGNDQLVLTLMPLKLGELLDLLDVLKSIGFEKGEAKTLTPAQMRAIAAEAKTYLPSHIEKMEGAEGFEVSDIVDYPDFLGLAVETVFELVRHAMPSENDVKN
jgi:hypothetical protein